MAPPATPGPTPKPTASTNSRCPGTCLAALRPPLPTKTVGGGRSRLALCLLVCLRQNAAPGRREIPSLDMCLAVLWLGLAYQNRGRRPSGPCDARPGQRESPGIASASPRGVAVGACLPITSRRRPSAPCVACSGLPSAGRREFRSHCSGVVSALWDGGLPGELPASRRLSTRRRREAAWCPGSEPTRLEPLALCELERLDLEVGRRVGTAPGAVDRGDRHRVLHRGS